MASKPTRVGRKFWIRWRFDGVRQNFAETTERDAKRAWLYITNLGDQIAADDIRLIAKHYLHAPADAEATPTRGGVSFGEAARRWLAANGRQQEHTKDRVRRQLEIHFAEWVHLPVAGFTNEAVDAKAAALRASGLKRSTVTNRMSVALAVLRWAHGAGLMPVPVDTRRLGFARTANRSGHELTESALTRAQFEALVSFTPDAFAADLVSFLAESGLRIGECFALTAGRCKTGADASVYVAAHYQYQKGKGWVIVPGTKAGPDRHRRVRLTPAAGSRLARWADDKPDGHLVWVPRTTAGRACADPYTAFRDRIWKPMVTAARAAGVIPHGMRLTPHVLRHTHATWAADAGMPMAQLQRRMGHASIEMTSRYYHDTTEAGVSERRYLDAMTAPVATVVELRPAA